MRPTGPGGSRRRGPPHGQQRADHRAGAAHEPLGMAGALRLVHREAHVGEQARRRGARGSPPRRPSYGAAGAAPSTIPSSRTRAASSCRLGHRAQDRRAPRAPVRTMPADADRGALDRRRVPRQSRPGRLGRAAALERPGARARRRRAADDQQPHGAARRAGGPAGAEAARRGRTCTPTRPTCSARSPRAGWSAGSATAGARRPRSRWRTRTCGSRCSRRRAPTRCASRACKGHAGVELNERVDVLAAAAAREAAVAPA